MDFENAKITLDKIIRKSRVHLYKPIQIAEILHRDRIYKDITISDLETYRNLSKKWRDDISLRFLGRVCTSSQKFQDNLFEKNATPPDVIEALSIVNRHTGGKVEAYIYNQLRERHYQMSEALSYCIKSNPATFDLETFLNMFRYVPGLKRSIDKIYEIVVYALFSVLVEELKVTITVSSDRSKSGMLKEFDDFAEKVICINSKNANFTTPARLYRVGVTNAADRGLDMWANFGPAVQIKHLTIDINQAQNIVSSVSADRVVIVCKDAEKEIIISLLAQIGWSTKVQSVITEKDLISWYEKGLRGFYSDILGHKILDSLENEIQCEFPITNNIDFENFYNKRGYDHVFPN